MSRSRFGPLTNQMRGALQFLAARGEMEVRRENRFIFDEISARTAWALERRGLAERRWAGGRSADNYIYITDEGRALADTLIGIDEEDLDDM